MAKARPRSRTRPFDLEAPALGMLEFSSVALGIRAGDAVVKKAPVRALVAGSVQPGKFLVLFDGDVASVEEALVAGAEAGREALEDRLFLPDAHPALGSALTGTPFTGTIPSLAVIETTTTAATLETADAVLKGARVDLVELRLADGLGGKGLGLYAGDVADAEIAAAIGIRVAVDRLVQVVVIPRLHGEMAENLLTGTRFAANLAEGRG